MTIEDKVSEFDPKKLARESLKFFMLYCDPYAQSSTGGYQIKDFHRKIIDVLEKVERGEIKRLMISVPPQHGKSSVGSVGFPAWSLGRNPYQNISLSSYSAELSEGFSRKTREMLRDSNYKSLFGELLSKDSQSVNAWNTIKGGGYSAVGVGGSLTGKTVDKLIIDDPHKDQEEAMSKLQRDKVWDWYTTVALTRCRKDTAIVIIMTRWHEDDLCGRLLEREAEDWTVLNIPVFNEDGTVIRPEMHPKELVEQKRKTMGESQFQALYMGDPLNEGGGDFKQDFFQYYEKSEIFDNYGLGYTKDLQVMTFIDPAISQKQTADSTAIVTVGLDKKNNNIYVIDIRHGKMLPDEIIDNVFSVVNTFKPLKVGIETNQFQKMLELEIRKQMRVRNTFFNLEGQTSSMNKEAKVRSVLQPRYSNATIIHQKRGNYVADLETQLQKFPNGKHDDIVDCLSMSIMMLSSVALNGKKAKIVKANWL